MRRTLMFDHLETRKLLTASPTWDPVIGWTTSPVPTGTLDATALDGAYTTPLATSPTPAIVYPFRREPIDTIPTYSDIVNAP